MIIEKLPGTEERLYTLVAPLIMSVPVIRQNNNYPFKTSRKHLWFVALDEGKVVGFMPAESKPSGVFIDNYYSVNDSSDLLMALVQEVIAEFAEVSPLYIVSHMRHAELFKSCGFVEIKSWKLYVKMEYEGK